MMHDLLRHKLERIAMDGVGKFPIFILPTINKCFELKIIPENSIESIASWYIFMKKIEFPDKQLIFTEGCQEGGPHIGSWDLGERYATSIINDLNRWTVAWIDWNLILNEKGGPNHVKNYCSAPIIVDTRSQELLYQSSYYYIGHFSRFILPGDKIVNSVNTNENIEVLSSIKNDESSTQTVILNKNDVVVEIEYNRDKIRSVFTIPKRSIITCITY